MVVTSRRPLVARRCLSLSLRMIFDCCCSRCLCCLRRLTFLRGLHSPLAGFAGHRRSRRVATRTGLNLNPLTGKLRTQNEPRYSLSLTAPETHLAYVAVVVFSTFSSLLAFWSAMKAALRASWLVGCGCIGVAGTDSGHHFPPDLQIQSRYLGRHRRHRNRRQRRGEASWRVVGGV